MTKPGFGKVLNLSGESALFGLAIAGFCLCSIWMIGSINAEAVDASDDVETVGGAACLECHGEIQDSRVGSNHGQIDCEACHGPLASHARNPGGRTPPAVEDDICLMCHEAGMGMPASFPTVDPKDHNAGTTCGRCHPSHHPEEGKK